MGCLFGSKQGMPDVAIQLQGFFLLAKLNAWKRPEREGLLPLLRSTTTYLDTSYLPR